jgi:hypothetical protein
MYANLSIFCLQYQGKLWYKSVIESAGEGGCNLWDKSTQ